MDELRAVLDFFTRDGMAILNLAIALIFASMIWGTILNGVRVTFISWPHFSVMGWRFWVYGLLSWIGITAGQILLGIY